MSLHHQCKAYPSGLAFQNIRISLLPPLLQSPQGNKTNHSWKSSQLFPALPNFCDKTEDDCFFSPLLTSLPLYLRISSKIPFYHSFWWRQDSSEHQRMRKSVFSWTVMGFFGDVYIHNNDQEASLLWPSSCDCFQWSRPGGWGFKQLGLVKAVLARVRGVD